MLRSRPEQLKLGIGGTRYIDEWAIGSGLSLLDHLLSYRHFLLKHVQSTVATHQGPNNHTNFVQHEFRVT